ncbi:hypothetical protein Tdes44962_MAKER08152 [Teratosphaeria destructans]|uniref:Myb-like domain-containing protein n=1 Tax=Teratosphaeria destructans TaxID=418781 RepID=A0A9W7SXM5_9PEZI|nr:hypothetical protein Tdes44962_MAKER08152 [Teratosphaeria destructans]
MRTKRAVLPLRYRYTGKSKYLVPPPYSNMPPAPKWQLSKWYDELTTAEWAAGKKNTDEKKRRRGNEELAIPSKKPRTEESDTTQDSENIALPIDAVDASSSASDEEPPQKDPTCKNSIPNFRSPKWSTAEKLKLFKAAEGKAIVADREEVMASYRAAGGAREFVACKKAYARFTKKGNTVESLEAELALETDGKKEEGGEE